MPPQSRGSGLPTGFQSKSTPNLPTLNSLSLDQAPQLPKPATSDFSTSTANDSPSEPASVEDNLSTTSDPFALDGPSSASTSASDDDFEFEFEQHHPALAQPSATSPTEHARSTSTEPHARLRRPLYSQASRSHSHLPHTSSALFPPFYNRPPTPLPPSPSLTSLLRPSFSTQTSRPTTPDSSDVEGPTTTAGRALKPTRSSTGISGSTASGTGTPTNNLASSFASATPIPRASPKVPTYEYYGFFIYLASSFAFLMYILWAYLPRPFLHQLGIYYYPNRWWALAVPAWLVMLVVYVYVALASVNVGYLTLRLGSCENLVDGAAQIAVLDAEGRIVRQGGSRRGRGKGSRRGEARARWESGEGRFVGGEGTDWARLWSESTDAVMDVPIGGVCEILYGEGRVREGWEGGGDGEEDLE